MLVERLRWQTQTGWRGEGPLSSADFVLSFGSADRIEACAAPAALAERYPGALLLGCSTAAGILDGVSDEAGVVGVACRLQGAHVRLVEADVPDASCSAEAGRQIGEALRGEGLAGAFILSDGVSVNGSAITSAIASVLGRQVPITGGLAADGARFLRTTVGVGQSPGRLKPGGCDGRADHAPVHAEVEGGPGRLVSRQSAGDGRGWGSRKTTKFGSVKWVFPKLEMTEMRIALEASIARWLPRVRVLYWT